VPCWPPEPTPDVDPPALLVPPEPEAPPAPAEPPELDAQAAPTTINATDRSADRIETYLQPSVGHGAGTNVDFPVSPCLE
jgi:hypothetical protein